MTEVRWSLYGLMGFVVSGLLFTISGIRAGDPWSIAGCVVWIAACGAWAWPLLGRLRDERAAASTGTSPSSRLRDAG